MSEYQKFINECLQINEAANNLGYFVAKYGLPGKQILKNMRKSSDSKIYKINMDNLKAREDWGVLGFSTKNGNKYALCWDPNNGWGIYVNGKDTYRYLKNWKACREWIYKMHAENGGIVNYEIEVLDRDPQFDNLRNMSGVGNNPQSPRAVLDKAKDDIRSTIRNITYTLDDILHKAIRDGVEPKNAVYIMLDFIKPINSIYKILQDNDSYLIDMLKTEKEWRWRERITDILSKNWSEVPEADIRKFANMNIQVNPDLIKRLNIHKTQIGEQTSLKVYDEVAAMLSPYIDMANYEKMRVRLLKPDDYVGSNLFKIDQSKFKTVKDLANFYNLLANKMPGITIEDVRSIWIEQGVYKDGIQIYTHNLPQSLNLIFDNKTGKLIKGVIR